MKKKLLMILGAGSSVPCGMPTVKQIDAWMKEWSREWESLPEFPKGFFGEGVFNELWNVAEEYYRDNPSRHLGIQLNFEKILGEMVALASWVTPTPFGNKLVQAVQNGKVSAHFLWRDYSQEPFFNRQLILEQLEYLLEKLAHRMRDLGKSLDTNSNEFANYQQIMSRLRDKFEVGIYNLNYDNVAVSAWPEAFTGFNEGRFDPKAIFQRTEWNFIYHLHGSIHNSIEGAQKKTVIWKNDLNGNFLDRGLTQLNRVSDYKPVPSTTLMMGGFKLDQLLSDPFQSFYSSLVRHTHEADTVLICGYGFSDAHVNRALQNRFDRFPVEISERPSTVVLTKNNQFGSTGLRVDLWAQELMHSLNTRFQNNGSASVDPSIITELVSQKRFETDFSGRIAIWHGGFTEVLGCMDKVISQLGR